MKKALCSLLISLIGGTSIAKEKPPEPNLEPIYFQALDGNVKAAMEKLSSIEPEKLSARERWTRKRFSRRFGSPRPSIHRASRNLATEIKDAYQDYWHEVLLQKMTPADGSRFLFEKLAPIVKRLGGRVGSYSERAFEAATEFLTAELRKRNYFAKFGTVQPYANFMSWKKQSTRFFHVNLGDGTFENVNVVLMRDFDSLGWAAYATFDRMYVGGWVGEEALYCVASGYDLNSEEFKVSFLAHEARHFADKRVYKSLSGSDLEYRAKLNEIFLAKESFGSVLKKFLLEQQDNLANPHSHASFRVMTDLSRKLGKALAINDLASLDKGEIQKFARDLLREDTLRLNDLTKNSF